jgi:hypothetical protein
MGPRGQIREVLVNEQEYQIVLRTPIEENDLATPPDDQDRMSGEAGIAGALPS